MAISMKERGSLLEHDVADYFKRLGFEVDANVELSDEADDMQEIDVLAKKEEQFGTLNVAVECKSEKRPIDADQVKEFHNKLVSLGIGKGIVVSTHGFTDDAIAGSKPYGIELWNLEEFKGKLEQVGGSLKHNPEAAEEHEEVAKMENSDEISDALPLDPNIAESILPQNIVNSKLFSTSISMVYDAYYFLEYRCACSYNIEGNWVPLDSEGFIVIEANNGKIISSRLSSGKSPELFQDQTFNVYLGIKPTTTTYTQLTSVVDRGNIIVKPFNIDEKHAKEIALRELIKGLTMEYDYSVKGNNKNGSYYMNKSKTLQPKRNDIDFLNVWAARIPTLYVNLSYKNKRYRRVVQGATNIVIGSETEHCSIPHVMGKQVEPAALCEECGAIMCEKHTQKCSTCGTIICDNCAQYCKTCKQPICKIHVQKCSICGSNLCSQCVTYCDSCKKVVCSKDAKACSECGKSFCDNCITTTGHLLMKKYYCSQHIPDKSEGTGRFKLTSGSS